MKNKRQLNILVTIKTPKIIRNLFVLLCVMPLLLVAQTTTLEEIRSLPSPTTKQLEEVTFETFEQAQLAQIQWAQLRMYQMQTVAVALFVASVGMGVTAIFMENSILAIFSTGVGFSATIVQIGAIYNYKRAGENPTSLPDGKGYKIRKR